MNFQKLWQRCAITVSQTCLLKPNFVIIRCTECLITIAPLLSILKVLAGSCRRPPPRLGFSPFLMSTHLHRQIKLTHTEQTNKNIHIYVTKQNRRGMVGVVLHLEREWQTHIQNKELEEYAKNTTYRTEKFKKMVNELKLVWTKQAHCKLNGNSCAGYWFLKPFFPFKIDKNPVYIQPACPAGLNIACFVNIYFIISTTKSQTTLIFIIQWYIEGCTRNHHQQVFFFNYNY